MTNRDASGVEVTWKDGTESLQFRCYMWYLTEVAIGSVSDGLGFDGCSLEEIFHGDRP